MKSDMDDAIREAHSYEDFVSLMQTKGYEVKGETFGDNALKYLSFLLQGRYVLHVLLKRILAWDIRKKQSESELKNV